MTTSVSVSVSGNVRVAAEVRNGEGTLERRDYIDPPRGSCSFGIHGSQRVQIVEQPEGPVAPSPERELTFGEKAVGLSFNPSQDPEVYACKAAFARVIDQMNDLRALSGSPEVKRMASVAITEAQTAQMWAVKAITWRG